MLWPSRRLYDDPAVFDARLLDSLSGVDDEIQKHLAQTSWIAEHLGPLLQVDVEARRVSSLNPSRATRTYLVP